MKIAWAIDIFDGVKNNNSRMARFLALFTTRKSDLFAAYVASPSESRLSTAFDVPESQRFSAYPLSLLKALVRKSKLPVLPQNLIVITSPDLSLTRTTDRLLQGIKIVKPDLLAIQTRQRGGLARALLGSFAETVIHRTTRPLLVVNPSNRLPTNIQTILFADDLSAESSNARGFVAEIAKHFGAEVRIVHADYLYGYGRKRKSAETNAYCAQVEGRLSQSEAYFVKRGINAHGTIDGSSKGVSDAVMASATKNGADLIVVSAKSGPLKALLGGSVTRKVVRESVLPVIVYRS